MQPKRPTARYASMRQGAVARGNHGRSRARKKCQDRLKLETRCVKPAYRTCCRLPRREPSQKSRRRQGRHACARNSIRRRHRGFSSTRKLPLWSNPSFFLKKKKKKNQSFQLIISIYLHSLSILFNRKGRNRLTSALRKKIINSGMIQLTRPSFLNCFTHRCICDIPNYHETIKPPEHTFSLIR